MLKRHSITALIVAVAAFALAATASAQWTHNGQHLQQETHVQFTGQLKYQGQLGSVQCWIHGQAALLPGQTTATITSIGIDLTTGGTVTETCEIDNAKKALGCTGVSLVTFAIGPGNHWTAHAVNTTQLAITTNTIQYHLHGGVFCPKTTQLTPGTISINWASDAFGTYQTTGTLQAHSPGGSQSVSITGAGQVTPSGTYGVT